MDKNTFFSSTRAISTSLFSWNKQVVEDLKVCSDRPGSIIRLCTQASHILSFCDKMSFQILFLDDNEHQLALSSCCQQMSQR